MPRAYDMSRDGKVIGLVVPGPTDASGGAAAQQIQVVLHGFDELKQRVPVK